jgi:hypothetical protein
MSWTPLRREPGAANPANPANPDDAAEPGREKPGREGEGSGKSRPGRDGCGCGCGAACAGGCPACACNRRVLIVGGIERMERKYRQMIEKEGGTLDYHSGNMQDGVKKLENCLQRADIVLCPVNCNSHGACSMVKRLGKKHNKPVHMMPNFSLHAISSALGTAPA